MLRAFEIQGEIPVVGVMDQWSIELTAGSALEAIELESVENEGEVNFGPYA